MPSPFPGMDPFLEDPEEFPDFHDSFIIHLRETLQSLLPEPYFSKTGQRVWVEVSERFVEPDVGAYRGNREAPTLNSGGIALLAKPRKVVVQVHHDEEREPFLEIYRKEGSGVRLVTSIEVLSPSNKTPGEAAQGLYKKKQLDILHSQVHLVEIDLLRGGHHSTAVPLQSMLAQTGPLDYHVCLHCFDRFHEYQVYPILLQESLPIISIPLLGEDQVEVHLQEVLTLTYDKAGFERWLEYRLAKLAPPLKPDQAAWAEGLLKQRSAAKT